MLLRVSKPEVSSKTRTGALQNARLTPHGRGPLVARVLRGHGQAWLAAQFRSSPPDRSASTTVRKLQLAALVLRRQPEWRVRLFPTANLSKSVEGVGTA